VPITPASLGATFGLVYGLFTIDSLHVVATNHPGRSHRGQRLRMLAAQVGKPDSPNDHRSIGSWRERVSAAWARGAGGACRVGGRPYRLKCGGFGPRSGAPSGGSARAALS
jgi:hypothetical protein